MLVRSEDVDPSLMIAEGLQALEDALSIVKCGQGWQDLDLSEGYDFRYLPLIVGIVHLEHVIGERLSEGQMVEINLTDPALYDLVRFKSQIHRLCAFR